MSNPNTGECRTTQDLPYYCSDTFTVALPVGLDLTEPSKAVGGDKAEERLACIIHRTHNDKDAERWGGFIPVNAKGVERLVGSRYASKALRALVRCGALERGKGYKVGRNASQYRLALPHRESPLQFRPLSDACLSHKMRAESEARNLAALAGCPVRAAVFANLGKVRLSAQVVEGIGRRTDLTNGQRNAWQFTAHDLQTGRYWLRIAENSGRIFHNLTSFPKTLRHLVMVGDEAAAEVDMRNAQPFFLLSLYPKAHPERAEFARVVSAGRFYETAFLSMDKTNRAKWGENLENWDIAGSSHRDQFKEHAIAFLLYAGLSPLKKPRAVFSALARPFPWLHAELTRRRSEKDGGSRLAVEMQRREAELMLGRVVPRVLTELPDCSPITLHDAILCQRSFAPAVGQIMEEETEKAYGARPSVKVSVFTDPSTSE